MGVGGWSISSVFGITWELLMAQVLMTYTIYKAGFEGQGPSLLNQTRLRLNFDLFKTNCQYRCSLAPNPRSSSYSNSSAFCNCWLFSSVLEHIHGIIQYDYIYNWILEFFIISARLIHIVLCSEVFLSVVFSYMNMPQCLHSPIDGHYTAF